ncbi:MAG TPA: Virginiamycin B lyase [Ktedonobacteraceae bacterium]|jgi:virginiamycin B lyase|nr:Virginiamycin B lyase [Ktedonobacteraceae bacterium]
MSFSYRERFFFVKWERFLHGPGSLFLTRTKHKALLQRACMLFFALCIWGYSGPQALAQTLQGQHMLAGVSPLKEYPLPGEHSGPSGLTQGPDGALWFTEFYANRIGRITTKGIITEFPLASFRQPSGITAGPDGNLWFAEEHGWIGRITPLGVVTEFALPSPVAEPTAITAGPDGNLWFTATGENAIGRITTSGQISLFPLPAEGSAPCGITRGPDGNLWFIEQYGKIGLITPRGKIREFARPNMESPAFGGITSGPDAKVWYTQGGGNNAGSLIGQIDAEGLIKTFSLPDASANPIGITSGPDGNLWFAELQSNKIGWITRQGIIKEYALPEKTGGPDYLITGPDGNLWFTSVVNNFIGLLSPQAARGVQGSSLPGTTSGQPAAGTEKRRQ